MKAGLPTQLILRHPITVARPYPLHTFETLAQRVFTADTKVH
ncbi:MAG: hypothetical protein QOH91_2153 [Mycobacterium sp.]|jgi:hypothetical protein|nr:hypothetical protein [Mycobacterium sp.]